MNHDYSWCPITGRWFFLRSSIINANYEACGFIHITTIPRCSMYGIFTYIYPKNSPNLGNYSIHGASGIDFHVWFPPPDIYTGLAPRNITANEPQFTGRKSEIVAAGWFRKWHRFTVSPGREWWNMVIKQILSNRTENLWFDLVGSNGSWRPFHPFPWFNDGPAVFSNAFMGSKHLLNSSMHFFWIPTCMIAALFVVNPSTLFLVGALEQVYFFSIYWEFHHPNWRSPSFFRGVAKNHQPGYY